MRDAVARTSSITLLASCLVACASSPLAEVVVVSDTDLDVPSEIETIHIVVVSSDGARQDAFADLAGNAPRPAIVGLVAHDGSAQLDVTVLGERGGIEQIRRTAHVTLVPAQVVAVRLDLWRRCVDVMCGDGQTCGDGGCRSTVLAPEELMSWSGEVPPVLDAGWNGDAGRVDGGADGGARDAGPSDAHVEIDAYAMPEIDAGPPDAWSECASAADCDDGWTCTDDACDAGRCHHAPRDSACDDGVACTTQRCDLMRGCLYVEDATLCDDGVACTNDVCDRLAGCRSTPRHTACASGEYCDPLNDCRPAPTFTDVYTGIIQVRCTPCHITAVPRSGGLDMGNEATARASLVGVTATCGGGANTRVIPGDSTHSLLWRKVAGVDLCGARMPRMLTPLTDTQIGEIAHWIDSGAL